MSRERNPKKRKGRRKASEEKRIAKRLQEDLGLHGKANSQGSMQTPPPPPVLFSKAADLSVTPQCFFLLSTCKYYRNNSKSISRTLTQSRGSSWYFGSPRYVHRTFKRGKTTQRLSFTTC